MLFAGEQDLSALQGLLLGGLLLDEVEDVHGLLGRVPAPVA